MDYLVKVTFSLGAQEYQPGDTVNEAAISLFLLELLRAGVIVAKPLKEKVKP